MTYFIVSGCPRSGTSMMMQILNESGMLIAEDKKRKADKDNKKGYYEVHMVINRLKEDPKIIDKFKGKILKIVHYGLKFLPKREYKIIYMRRNIDEVLDSMEKMSAKKDSNREETRRIFLNFDKNVEKLMEEREDIDYIVVNYNSLIKNLDDEIRKVADFLEVSEERIPKMIKAVDFTQYRNRR